MPFSILKWRIFYAGDQIRRYYGGNVRIFVNSGRKTRTTRRSFEFMSKLLMCQVQNEERRRCESRRRKLKDERLFHNRSNDANCYIRWS